MEIITLACQYLHFLNFLLWSNYRHTGNYKLVHRALWTFSQLLPKVTSYITVVYTKSRKHHHLFWKLWREFQGGYLRGNTHELVEIWPWSLVRGRARDRKQTAIRTIVATKKEWNEKGQRIVQGNRDIDKKKWTLRLDEKKGKWSLSNPTCLTGTAHN